MHWFVAAMLFATATFAEAAPTDFHCDELQRFRDNDLGVELRQLHRQLQLGQMALGFVDMSDPEQPRMATVEPPLREDLPYTNRYVASMAKMAILTTILKKDREHRDSNRPPLIRWRSDTGPQYQYLQKQVTEDDLIRMMRPSDNEASNKAIEVLGSSVSGAVHHCGRPNVRDETAKGMVLIQDTMASYGINMTLGKAFSRDNSIRCKQNGTGEPVHVHGATAEAVSCLLYGVHANRFPFSDDFRKVYCLPESCGPPVDKLRAKEDAYKNMCSVSHYFKKAFSQDFERAQFGSPLSHLTPGARICRKSGTWDIHQADAAFIDRGDGKRFILTLISNQGMGNEEGDAVMQKVYEGVQSYMDRRDSMDMGTAAVPVSDTP